MASDTPGEHLVTEGSKITVETPDHPERKESAAFRQAKTVAHKIVPLLVNKPYGEGPWQMHHGASIYLYDGEQWHLVLGPVGIEWSMQFCASIAKVEALRLVVVAMLDAFPHTRGALKDLGYHDIDRIDQPITTVDDVAWYVDSLFNSCVPMAARVHTGVIPTGPGIHHYPKPVIDGEFIRRDDFNLFVVTPEGHHVAVTPVSHDPADRGKVEVVYAPPGSPLHAQQTVAHRSGKRLVLDASHPLARQAHNVKET